MVRPKNRVEGLKREGFLPRSGTLLSLHHPLLHHDEHGTDKGSSQWNQTCLWPKGISKDVSPETE